MNAVLTRSKKGNIKKNILKVVYQVLGKRINKFTIQEDEECSRKRNCQKSLYQLTGKGFAKYKN